MIRFSCDQDVSGVSAHTISRVISNEKIGNHELSAPVPQVKKSHLKFRHLGDLSVADYGYGSKVMIKESAVDNCYHLRVILSGLCLWSIGGSKISLKVGASIVTSPNADPLVTYSRDCRILIVKIPADFLLKTAREFGYIMSNDSMAFLESPLVCPSDGPVFSLLSGMIDQGGSTMPDDRITLYYSKLFCHEILRCYGKNLCKSRRLPRSFHPNIEQIRDYVLENITDNVSISDLAQICRVSLKSLYNLFERELGLTPSNYIRRLTGC